VNSIDGHIGVTGYNIFRGGVKIGTAEYYFPKTEELSASTSYTYQRAAFDAAGNTPRNPPELRQTTQAANRAAANSVGARWYQIPSTSIQSLCPSYPEIQGTQVARL